MTRTKEIGIGLGRPLSELLPEEDEGARLALRLFAESGIAERLAVLDAALALAAGLLPDDLFGYSFWSPTGAPVMRLVGPAETTEAWALADALRAAADQQLPVSTAEDQGSHLAVPCGPGAAIGVRRAGRLVIRETLLVEALARVCLFADPNAMPIRWR